MKIKYLHLLLFIFTTSIANAQNTRYIDAVFTDISKTTVTYSDVFNDDFHKMDIYVPKNDTFKSRPLIIFAHGGAFYAGDKASQDCIDFCTSFAKKGYTAVSVNYRLANAFVFLTDKKVQLNAVLQTMADIKSSIRYLVKDASNSNQYRVDTNSIFLGGYSAGAVAALHTGWVTKESELDANILGILKTGIKTLAGDAGNNGYSNPIKALYSMAGGLYQTSYLSEGDIPVWMGHATDDATVSYNCAPALNNPLVVTLCGTGKMIARIDTVKIKFDTMILATGGHGWPGLGNSGKDFKIAVAQIADFFYPMIGQQSVNSNPKFGPMLLNIYPNPAKESFTIENLEVQKGLTYSMCDIMGRPVKTGPIKESPMKIDVRDLPIGMYYLKLSNTQYRTARILID